MGCATLRVWRRRIEWAPDEPSPTRRRRRSAARTGRWEARFPGWGALRSAFGVVESSGRRMNRRPLGAGNAPLRAPDVGRLVFRDAVRYAPRLASSNRVGAG